MKTSFSEERWTFTKRAHAAAQQQFYTRMFPHGVTFEDTTETARDLDYAIDCQLAIDIPDRSFRAPIRLSVQERFRKPEEMRYGDVTITEWNLASGQPSELHKLGAQLFVYGFYDEKLDHITYATAVDVVRVQWSLSRRYLGYQRRRRLDQSFIGLKFQELRDLGAVVFTHDARVERAELLLRLENAGITDSWREDDL